MSILFKVCNDCDNLKSHDAFSKDNGKSDGRFHNCKDCDRLNNQMNYGKTIVHSSRSNDKKYNRTSTLQYITEKHIDDLLEKQYDKCIYCDDDMQFGICCANRVTHPEGLTLERINNAIPHIVENCVLACNTCNGIRGHHFAFDEMKLYGKDFKNDIKRRCGNCKTIFEINQFSKSRVKRGGFSNICKTCDNARNALKRNRIRDMTVVS